MNRRGAAFVTILQGGVSQVTKIIQPDSSAGQDTFVSASAADTNNGNAANLVVRSGASARNTLIKFDLSEIPAGSTILSAKLYLYSQALIPATGSFTLNSILVNNSTWTEASTWNYKTPSTVRWTGDAGGDGGPDAGCSQSGVDFNAAALGTFGYTTDTPTETEYEITLAAAQVEAWLTANYGFVIRQTSGTAANYAFHSCEAAAEAVRPKLVVVYLP